MTVFNELSEKVFLNMKKIYITGMQGFVGGILKDFIEREYKQGVVLELSEEFVDIRDRAALDKAFSRTLPDWVIHLAAISHVPDSFKNPRLTYDTNFLGTLNLLEALRDAGFKGRFLYVGSSDEYGLANAESLPLKETSPLRPRSPYAVSKLAAEAMCYQWSVSEEMDIMMARPFIHIGPGQSDSFVMSNFARQIVEAEAGRSDGVIRVGNIDITRDFTDARDTARAYILLMEKGSKGETYNVCSGVERSLRDMLTMLLEASDADIRIEKDPSRMRKTDQKRMVGSNEKIRAHLNWEPRINIKSTLMELIEYWRKKSNE